ncbi:hypothetical protein ACFCYN_23855 [Gottfriedia sp. NPDC056225]|nr:hypothetical protein HPK19_05445 [Arthrobacter citreus]
MNLMKLKLHQRMFKKFSLQIHASIYKFQKNTGINENTALSQSLEIQLLH